MNVQLIALVPGSIGVRKATGETNAMKHICFAAPSEGDGFPSNVSITWGQDNLAAGLSDPDESKLTVLISEGGGLLVAEHAAFAWQREGPVSRIASCTAPISEVHLSEDRKLIAVLAEIDLFVIDVACLRLVLSRALDDVAAITKFGTTEILLKLFDGSELTVGV